MKRILFAILLLGTSAFPPPTLAETAKKPKSTPAPAERPVKSTRKPEVTPKLAATATPPPSSSVSEAAESKATPPGRAPAATLEASELHEFTRQLPRVQQLITAALALTKLNLTYTYGSADPAKGGMDCSGTMYHLLRAQGFAEVPRDSSNQYAWARKRGPFFAVVSRSAGSFEFDDLRPGDLLFWTGTYETQREIPISHVMLYLGTEKKTRKRVMFGASDGRSYAGIQRWGVSVFDFKMPRENGANGNGARVDFVGYARIPGLHDAASSVAAGTPVSSDAAAENPAPPPMATPAPTKSTAGKNAKSATPKPAAAKRKEKSAAASH